MTENEIKREILERRLAAARAERLHQATIALMVKRLGGKVEFAISDLVRVLSATLVIQHVTPEIITLELADENQTAAPRKPNPHIDKCDHWEECNARNYQTCWGCNDYHHGQIK